MSVRSKVIESYKEKIARQEKYREFIKDCQQIVRVEFLRKNVKDYLGLEVAFGADMHTVEDMVFTVSDGSINPLQLLIETGRCPYCEMKTYHVIKSMADIGEGIINPIHRCFNSDCEEIK